MELENIQLKIITDTCILKCNYIFYLELINFIEMRDIMTYSIIIVKFIVTFIVLFTYVKISGKSQLAPMSTLDQVGNMVIGALVGGTLLNQNINSFDSIIVVGIWASILIVIRLVKSKSIKAKDFFDGRRIQLIKDGKLLTNNFSKINLLARDINTLIHQKDITNLNDICNLWFEPNGQITLDKKNDDKNSIIIIESGVLNLDNLKKIHRNESWVEEELTKYSLSQISEVFYGEFYKNKLYIYPYEKTL